MNRDLSPKGQLTRTNFFIFLGKGTIQYPSYFFTPNINPPYSLYTLRKIRSEEIRKDSQNINFMSKKTELSNWESYIIITFMPSNGIIREKRKGSLVYQRLF
jgi:hypothetical protein